MITVELRHLRYFVAIAEERSFTRAAERLWVAQPGLSSQIRRLETELGVQLFKRHTRGVDLTDAGELFLERARAALAAADVAHATGRDLDAGIAGSLRLGVATETPTPVTPSLLAAFAHRHPDVEVTAVESYGGTLLRDLRDGRLDAVIAPLLFASAELRSVRLGSEPWVLLVGRGHRLWKPGPVDVCELRGESLVITGHRDGRGHDRLITELLSEVDVATELVHGGAGPALRTAVVAGEAVALSTAAARVDGELLVRPLHPTRRMRFALLSRDETPAPVLRELVKTAEATVAAVRQPIHPALRAVA